MRRKKPNRRTTPPDSDELLSDDACTIWLDDDDQEWEDGLERRPARSHRDTDSVQHWLADVRQMEILNLDFEE